MIKNEMRIAEPLPVEMCKSVGLKKKSYAFFL